MVRKGTISGRTGWILHDIPLPVGVNLIFYERNSEPLEVRCPGGHHGMYSGPQLATTERLTREKAERLPAWPPYDERWLLFVGGVGAKVTVNAVRYSRQRFPNTGFVAIYLIDGWHSIQAKPKTNAVRLDVFEDF